MWGRGRAHLCSYIHASNLVELFAPDVHVNTCHSTLPRDWGVLLEGIEHWCHLLTHTCIVLSSCHCSVLQSCGEPSNMEEYLNRILETDFGHSTLVDCSNGIELAQCYEVLLQKGMTALFHCLGYWVLSLLI